MADVSLQSYAELRAYTGSGTTVDITTSGIWGRFHRVDSDTTSLDNGGTVLVGASNRRWKRQYTGGVHVEWFGAKGDGTTNDTAAFQAAVNFGGEVNAIGGKYKIDSRVSIKKNNVVLNLGRSVFDLSHWSKTSESSAFGFEGDGYASQVAVLGPVAKGAISINVSNAASFSIGEWIGIRSSDIFLGITGQSGYSPRTKGEFLQIAGISENTLYFTHVTQDSYSTSIAAVKYKWVEGLTINGGIFIGYDHEQEWTGTTNPTGVRAITTASARRVSIRGTEYHGFCRFAASHSLSVDVFQDEIRVYGPDKTKMENASISKYSKWYTGINFSSCQNFGVRNSCGYYLRRLMDFDSPSNIVSRNAMQVNCIMEKCYNGLGSHQGENFLASGNTFVQCRSINSRARNVVFDGNRGTLGGDVADQTAASISFGPDISQTTAGQTQENSNIGTVVLSNNVIEWISPSTHMVLLRTYCDIVVVSNNTFKGPTTNGVCLRSPFINNLRIENNIFYSTSTNSGAGVLQENTDNLCKGFPYGSISGNQFYGFSYDILLAGYGGTTATNTGIIRWWPESETFRVTNNTFRGRKNNIKFGDDTVAPLNGGVVTGYFPQLFVLGNNKVGNEGSGSAQQMISYDGIVNSRIFGMPMGGHNTLGNFYSTGIPLHPVGNWPEGNYSYRSVYTHITINGELEFICNVRGTKKGGTLPAASMNSGSASLIFASSVEGVVFPGQYLNITGAAASGENLVNARVTRIVSPTNVILSKSASTSVSSAAVTWAAPTFVKPSMVTFP